MDETERLLGEIQHLREIITQRLDMTDAATVTSATELARRLDDLNHVAKLRAERDRDFVSMARFESRTDQIDARLTAVVEQIDARLAAIQREVVVSAEAHGNEDRLVHQEISRRLSDLETWRATQSGASAAVQRIAALIGALVGALVSGAIAFYTMRGR